MVIMGVIYCYCRMYSDALTFHIRSSSMVIMNRLSTAKQTAVVAALVEGCSIRATVRMTGVAKNTVVKLIRELGAVCSKYQDQTIRNVKARRVQCDEIWSFVGSKEKNTGVEKKAHGWGDCWTWTALDADTKLMISFRLGDRSLNTAYDFMHDVAERLAGRIQLTTDGNRVYIEAVESAFQDKIDYAMLRKLYGADPEASETRYSPAKCIGCEMKKISGNPDPKHVFLRATWSGPISRCECRCGDSLGSPMASPKSWITTRRWWPYTLCITTSPGFTRRCGRLRRRLRA